MNRRSQLIIGATLLTMGVGVYALGLFEDESRVRYVEDLHESPQAHREGTWTLLGIPRAAQVGDVVHHAVRGDDGVLRSTSMRLVGLSDGAATWNLTTSIQDTAGGLPSQQSSTWTAHGRELWVVQAFGDGVEVFATFDGTLKDPLQPKPSQLRGHLADAPDGALLYAIEPDGVTVGCSSKFLPDEVAAEYDPDGDGYADGT